MPENEMEKPPGNIYLPDGDVVRYCLKGSENNEYIRADIYWDLRKKYADTEIARIQAEIKLAEITNLIQSFYPDLEKKDA